MLNRLFSDLDMLQWTLVNDLFSNPQVFCTYYSFLFPSLKDSFENNKPICLLHFEMHILIFVQFP